MKKRGLKRYYRKLSKENFAKNIIAELKSSSAEYDYEHIHLDGYILTKWTEVKQHLDVLFRQLETFKQNSDTVNSPFQVWGYICLQKDYGCQIALYVHTPNCNYDDFPHTETEALESTTIPPKELLDYLKPRIADGYQIRYSRNCDGEPEIFIAIPNVGLSIFNCNVQGNETPSNGSKRKNEGKQ